MKVETAPLAQILKSEVIRKLSPKDARVLLNRLEKLKFKPLSGKWYEKDRNMKDIDKLILRGKVEMAKNDLRERLNEKIQ